MYFFIFYLLICKYYQQFSTICAHISCKVCHFSEMYLNVKYIENGKYYYCQCHFDVLYQSLGYAFIAINTSLDTTEIKYKVIQVQNTQNKHVKFINQYIYCFFIICNSDNIPMAIRMPIVPKNPVRQRNWNRRSTCYSYHSTTGDTRISTIAQPAASACNEMSSATSCQAPITWDKTRPCIPYNIANSDTFVLAQVVSPVKQHRCFP